MAGPSAERRRTATLDHRLNRQPAWLSNCSARPAKTRLLPGLAARAGSEAKRTAYDCILVASRCHRSADSLQAYRRRAGRGLEGDEDVQKQSRRTQCRRSSRPWDTGQDARLLPQEEELHGFSQCPTGAMRYLPPAPRSRGARATNSKCYSIQETVIFPQSCRNCGTLVGVWSCVQPREVVTKVGCGLGSGRGIVLCPYQF